MGSPLGPTFANLYMADLENSVLPNFLNENPHTSYMRYVDDTFLIIKNEIILQKLIAEFEKQSCLKFTHEVQNNESIISFLDVDVEKKLDSFEQLSTINQLSRIKLFTMKVLHR